MKPSKCLREIISRSVTIVSTARTAAIGAGSRRRTSWGGVFSCIGHLRGIGEGSGKAALYRSPCGFPFRSHLCSMARRASSSAHPVWMLVACALALGAIAGGYFLYGRVSESVSNDDRAAGERLPAELQQSSRERL